MKEGEGRVCLNSPSPLSGIVVVVVVLEVVLVVLPSNWIGLKAKVRMFFFLGRSIGLPHAAVRYTYQ